MNYKKILLGVDRTSFSDRMADLMRTRAKINQPRRTIKRAERVGYGRWDWNFWKRGDAARSPPPGNLTGTIAKGSWGFACRKGGVANIKAPAVCFCKPVRKVIGLWDEQTDCRREVGVLAVVVPTSTAGYQQVGDDAPPKRHVSKGSQSTACLPG